MVAWLVLSMDDVTLRCVIYETGIEGRKKGRKKGRREEREPRTSLPPFIYTYFSTPVLPATLSLYTEAGY